MPTVIRKVSSVSGVRRALLLTGGPAVGKTTSGRTLARSRTRCAFIDVDDLRQLVVSGHVPPWHGMQGAAQRTLGAINAAELTRNFLGAQIECVIVDVVTAASVQTYRAEIPDVFIVHLRIPVDGARRRAATREAFLTADEFDALHQADATSPPLADAVLDVDTLSVNEQVMSIDRLWSAAPATTS